MLFRGCHTHAYQIVLKNIGSQIQTYICLTILTKITDRTCFATFRFMQLTIQKRGRLANLHLKCNNVKREYYAYSGLFPLCDRRQKAICF